MSLDGGPITAASVDQRAFDPIRRSNYPDARVSQWEIDGLGLVAAVSPGLKIVRMRF